MMKVKSGFCLVIAFLSLANSTLAAGFITLPENGTSIAFMKENEPYLSLDLGGWGPSWSWMGFDKASVEVAGEACLLKASGTVPKTKAQLSCQILARKSAPATASYEVALSTDRDTALTFTILTVTMTEGILSGGKVALTYSDGSITSLDYPWGRKVGTQEAGKLVEKMAVTDGKGVQTVFRFSPATKVVSDGNIRIVLAESSLAADKPVKLKMDVAFPEPLAFYLNRSMIPQEPGFENWYEFKAGTNHLQPSAISMADWLDKPAGKNGRIMMQGDKLIQSGKAVKLWGINVCYASCAPDKALADQRAALYAKYGINSVRYHKFADGEGWSGICANDSFAEFDAKALDRMDYFTAQLKQSGIYVKLSANFGVKIGEKDKSQIPYWNEFGAQGIWREAPSGSQYFCRELGDLKIQQMVNLLQHKNPYTGLTYGEDPAIFCVEMVNEENTYWFSIMKTIKSTPTVRARVGESFTNWLVKKYGRKEAWLAAWGDKAVNSFAGDGFAGESWENKTIMPAGNPWYYAPEQLDGSQRFRRQRLLDTMEFLYGVQNDFYGRYQKAVRAAGYKGVMIASNWQAGQGAGHYYNLHTDYTFGLIDRHNYFGGGSQTAIDSSSMLMVPGSGMLSSGLQQVSDRPFMISEWIHVTPSEWCVEGPALMGAYGMGLQGWDVSYMFQNRDIGKINNEFKDQWQIDKPTILGIFPAVARQVLRGDVKESSLIIPRYVHIPSLKDNRMGFTDASSQQGDTKSFDSDKVSGKALAVGRCVVEFTDADKATPPFNVEPYSTNGVVTSATRQLAWTEGRTKADGYFTMDTDGTKAVVGFAAGKTCKLGSVTIRSDSRFVAIYLTAAERDASIASSKHLLITAMARTRLTGMKVFADTYIVEPGRPPLVMEPVKAEMTLQKDGNATVYLLDHDGVRTEKTIPINKGVIQIDTARDMTPYYEVVYK